EQAEMALAEAEPIERARALWLRAQAEHAVGLGAAAETTCLAVAADSREPLGPRALTAAAGWRWNADDDAGALGLFAEVLRRFPDSPPAPAGRGAEARNLLVHVAERHPRSYYAELAEERLGRRGAAGERPAIDRTPPFPGELDGSHGERARVLAQLGFGRFARLELDAIPPAGVPRRRLLEAYRAVGAVGAALRLAHVMRPASPGALREYLYPLGYWETVRAAALARGVDPFFVLALIRQESLFEPEATSSAGARGLMQLLPATARHLASADGTSPPAELALEDVETNIDLGTRLLARLLRQFRGSLVKALA